MNRLLSFLLAFAALVAAKTASAAPLVEASISSRFLVTGEQAVLEIVYPGDDMPNEALDMRIPDVPKLTIKATPQQGGLEWQQRLGMGRRWQYICSLTVFSYTPGEYTIPALEIMIDGEIRRTAPIELQVINEDDLKWSKTTVDRQEIRYAAAFHALKGNPYVGEKQPVELKVYFPIEQDVEDWGIPDFERDGLSAWRFQPQQPNLRGMGIGMGSSSRRASLLGRGFHAISYPSTMSTNRVGESTLGPASVKIQAKIPSVDRFSAVFHQPVTLNIPAIKLNSKPLPPGAPDGFDNAIGQFELQVGAVHTEIREGDPLMVDMAISGSGNLDALQPPKPIDADGWKLFETSAVERGEERREMYGQVNFRQLMRPLRMQTSIPSFRFVYFDPVKSSYEILLSDAIPLSMLPSTAAPLAGAAVPQALPMPLEEMTDILGIVQGPVTLLTKRVSLPQWLWQVIPALIVAGLLARIARLKLGPRMQKDPDQLAREKEWRDVERAPEQAGPFYRSVGHFIERWLGGESDPMIAETLAKRDEVCFRQDAAETKLDRSERQRVLKQLRRIALPLVIGFIALSTQFGFSQTADAPKLYEEGRYGDAAKAWLDSGDYEQLPPDTLYNIGNAAYRLGSPGEAALYYRRTLLRDGSHAEARQNLRFLERKFGSITIQRPDYQHQLARLPLDTWKGFIWAGAWMIIVGLLIFPATRPGAGIRTVSIAAFVTAPLLAAAGIVAWHYYPDDARFAPAKEQVVVVADSAAVRTDAARGAPKVIDAPAGSLCKLITKSGDWAYVAFTNESRGWLPLREIEPLIPDTKPAPPKVRPIQKLENNA
ncbi:BatD family protein [Haloferula sp. BvORR071]|uniref:BatD family protein n=1 Tax=Haloferula sp. BvORR071 TaxID=1396141 RepID=UPI002240FBCF|nr:BatD family protein [Haloferula sp. BvORR071]